VLQLYFANLEVREDLLAGPMGAYLPALAVKLSELGYSRGQARRLLVTADALGRWLKEHGVTPTEATADHVRAYTASHQRTPAGKLRDTATGLTHLVEYLKPWGILRKPCLVHPPTNISSDLTIICSEFADLPRTRGTRRRITFAAS
jgi:hypothetical protein